MTDDRLKCGWCEAENPSGTAKCTRCGAPLDEAEVVTTESGWRKVPRLTDGTDVAFGSSSVETDGEIVPMVSITLGKGDSVYFEHHALLWTDDDMQLGQKKSEGRGGMGGMLSRIASGAPKVLMTAEGPGRLAVSRDSVGEVVILPVSTKHEIDVRAGGFILASHTLKYSFEKTGTTHVERFTAEGSDGLLVLHGSADVFQKELGAGQTIFVEPGAYLYKDSSVKDEQYDWPGVKTHGLGGKMHMIKLTGPGRVGIQSMYHAHHIV